MKSTFSEVQENPPLSPVDLTNCDREPIRFLGKIQSHGFLIAIDSNSFDIRYVSSNLSAFVGNPVDRFLGRPFAEIENFLTPVPPTWPLTISQVLQAAGLSKRFDSMNPIPLYVNAELYDLIICLSGDHLILDFEKQVTDADPQLQKTLGRSISEILSGQGTELMLSKAAWEIKYVTSFDRVMIYQFSEDGHGSVIAEAKNEDLEAFLGLNYPASDIPKQARELYKVNLTRIIADVGSEDSPLLPYDAEKAMLDLTYSGLRAVSPMHIQYLKNMGVASSFSISLIMNDELWGLISCHNYTPKFINYRSRESAKLIGQVLSSALEHRETEASLRIFTGLSAANNILIKKIEKEINIHQALTSDPVSLLHITNATGAVLVFDQTISRMGNTPDEESIKLLVTWLKTNVRELVYFTNRLPELWPEAKRFQKLGSGIMACMISAELNEWMIWFKPEIITSVNWAGNPEKPVSVSEDGTNTLTPRKSFASWTDIVSGHSAKWAKEEILIVSELREHVTYAITRKANEIRALNEKLQTAFDELDTFSYTMSHDLRTPLASIKGLSEILLLTNKSLDENAKWMLEKIMASTNKMNTLIKEILHYSTIGRTDIRNEPVNMQAMIHEIRKEMTEISHPESPKLVFEVGDTPSIMGDPVMIGQVFNNLIGNAVKYSSKSNPSRVTVFGVKESDYTTYSISDNGVGIDVTYYNRVFELFKRMDNAKDFEGTGVGLAIVKRIIERHQARIWFESKLGMGTVFHVSFKNNFN